MPAPTVATLAVAWALHALPMQLAGAQPWPDGAPSSAALSADDDVVTVRVGEARARWYAALDAAHWDRDGAHAEADVITNELLPLVTRTDEPGHDAAALIAEIGADALGTWLHTQSTAPQDLVRAYLTRHDDPTLLARLFAAPIAGMPFNEAEPLARAHRAAAAPTLASTYASLAGYPRSVVCDAALALPGASRLDVARAVVATWRGDAAEDLAPQCVVLGALLPEGRARLTQWLRRLEPPGAASAMQVPPMWTGVGLLALAGSDHASQALAIADHLLGARGPVGDRLYYWMQLTEPIGHLVGWLALGTTAARNVLARLTTVLYPEQAWIGLARLRAGDRGVLAEALETLRNPNLAEGRLEDALGLAGIAAGATSAEAADLRGRLASLANLLRSQSHPEPSRPEIEAWIAAVERVSSCAGRRACLVGVLERGSDDAAARAVHALGARGLASLTRDEAQPLLRRLLVAPAPWLVAAFAVTATSCPAALRGVREMRADDSNGAGPFLRALQRTCAESSR